MKKKVGLIVMLIIAVTVLMMISCKEQEPDCRGIRQKLEQIKDLGGDNEAWIRNKILELQLDYPNCL